MTSNTIEHSATKGYIVQKVKVDNHYVVRQIANDI